MSNLENRRPEQPPASRGSTFHPGRIVSLSSRGEVTQGSPLDIPPHGRPTERVPSIDRREHVQQHVEHAGQPAHMQLLSEMAAKVLGSDDTTEPPPTPRLGFLELDPEGTSSPPLREADHPVVSFDAPFREEEGSSLEPLEFSNVTNIPIARSVRENLLDIANYRKAAESLSSIANAELLATTAFLNAHPSDSEHKRFMELMHQAHTIKDSREIEEICNALYNYFQPKTAE